MVDLSAAIEDPTQGEIVLPPGLTVLTEPLVIRRPVTIRGMGGLTRIHCRGAGQIVPAEANISIERLRLTSETARPAIETPSGPGRGVYALTLDRLRIVAHVCIRLADVVDVTIRDSRIYPRGGVGLDVDGYGFRDPSHFGADDNSDAIHVADCRFGGTRHGAETLVRLTGSAHASFHMARFNFGHIGLEMQPGAMQEPKFVQLLGCGFENHGAEALRIEAGRMLRITDLYASHDSEGRHSVVYFGKGFAGEAQITGGMVRGGARDGIRIVAGDVVQLANVRSANNGRCVPGDGLRVFPGLRKLVTRGVEFDPYSDGIGGRQRHGHKIEAGEWVSA